LQICESIIAIDRWPDKRAVDTSNMCYDHVPTVTDEPGITLVGFHFSVNKPLSGVDAGDYNVDIRSKTGASSVGTYSYSLKKV